MEYALIYANFDDPLQASKSHGLFRPYGLSILSESLKKKGFSGKTFLTKEEYSFFIRERPDSVRLIGVSATSFSRFEAIRIIKECRSIYPKALIVAGGCHFGSCAKDSIQNIPELDIVVRGDGEEAICELMFLSLGRKDIRYIRGITYRDPSGKITEQGEPLAVEELGGLDFMDSFYNPEEFQGNPLSDHMPIPSMNILAGRGCPYKCIFCSVNRVKNRMYPVETVIGTIERTTKKYGIKGVKFFDDSLTLNEDYMRQLCAGLIKRKLDIFWLCDSRANINLELIPLMYAAGCRFISVGLESGSPKIQKIISKNISNEGVLRFVKKCRQVGIRPYIFLMVGFPQENEQDLEMTLEFCRRLCRLGAIAGTAAALTIFPGTEVEQMARARGILPEGFSWSGPYEDNRNTAYGQFAHMPVYTELLTPELFRDFNQKLLEGYASGMPLKAFFVQAMENLRRKDLAWGEKMQLGKTVIFQRMKYFLKRE